MLKSKMISLSDEHLSKSSLASYYISCIESGDQLQKTVGIITLGETLYSKYFIASVPLEQHFGDFFALSGHLPDEEILQYQAIRNTMDSAETVILIGSNSNHIHSLLNQTVSGKTSTHRVVNVSQSALIQGGHTLYNIGYTRHNTSLQILNTLDTQFSISLGSAKQDITLVEPLVRDARVAVIDLALISSASVGFTIFEMCSIARYLGYSSTLDTLYLYHSEILTKDYPVEQAALLTWYFLEGRQHRQDDYPTNPSNQIYLVHSTLLDVDLQFSKSNLTGRWWIQHPQNDSNYIPVSFSEYQSVINNEIPNRLLDLIS